MNYQNLWHQLAKVYDEGEAKAIARMVYEEHYGLTLADLLLGKDELLTGNQQEELALMAQRLLRQEPVQYVLGQTSFCGRTFMVNQHVLIPRPETEELCRWVVDEFKGSKDETRTGRHAILDIGTGSGCIAVTLAAELPGADVTAWDVSEEALRVATMNAKRTGVHVSFAHVDMLQPPHSTGQPADCIISNPPYICNKERAGMEQNVLGHEPHLALFVPDEDPLLFYRAIAQYGLQVLTTDGALYFEINPLYAELLQKMLRDLGYLNTETRQDQFGKPRMMKARR